MRRVLVCSLAVLLFGLHSIPVRVSRHRIEAKRAGLLGVRIARTDSMTFPGRLNPGLLTGANINIVLRVRFPFGLPYPRILSNSPGFNAPARFTSDGDDLRNKKARAGEGSDFFCHAPRCENKERSNEMGARDTHEDITTGQGHRPMQYCSPVRAEQLWIIIARQCRRARHQIPSLFHGCSPYILFQPWPDLSRL